MSKKHATIPSSKNPSKTSTTEVPPIPNDAKPYAQSAMCCHLYVHPYKPFGVLSGNLPEVTALVH